MFWTRTGKTWDFSAGVARNAQWHAKRRITPAMTVYQIKLGRLSFTAYRHAA